MQVQVRGQVLQKQVEEVLVVLVLVVGQVLEQVHYTIALEEGEG